MINIRDIRNQLEKKVRRVEKRIRLAITVLIMAAVMLVSTFYFFDKAIIFIPLLFILSYILTYFALLPGIEKVGWFTLFFMPVAITLSFYLFYFLIPPRWITRMPFIIIYGISLYAVLLCSNIFNVGVEKNLQLYRAAFSINFFYQAVILFMIYNLLFSTKQSFLNNMIIGGGVSFIAAVNLFWTIRLNKQLERETVAFGMLIGLVIAELSMILSLVPLNEAIISLFLTASYYSLGGLIFNFIDQRLFRETIREYVIVWVFVLGITLLSISW